MFKKPSILAAIAISIFILVLAINFLLTYFIEKKIQSALEKEDSITITYSDFDYSLHTNSFSFEEPEILINDVTKNYRIKAENIDISSINWYDLLKNKQVNLGTVNISKPDLKLIKLDDTQNKKSPKRISIDKLKVSDGSIFYSKKETTKIEKLNLEIDNIAYNDVKDFFDYEIITLDLENMSKKINAYDLLQIKHLESNDTHTQIDSLSIVTTVSKKELSRRISVERNHYNLIFPHIELENFNISKKDKKISFSATNILAKNSDLTFYKDKSIKDKTAYKPLYSELIRDLNAYVHFPLVTINNGKVAYQAVLKEDQEEGEIYFEKMNATLNVSNMPNFQSLNLDAKALFMGKSPITLNIDFTDLKNDYFTAKGKLQKFKTEYINTFLYNILNTHLNGEVETLYYTITGNNEVSKTELRIKYDELELLLMKEDVLKPRKLLNKIGNMLFKNTSINSEDGFREGSAETERDKTKSLFNFLWLSLKDGIFDSITGKQ